MVGWIFLLQVKVRNFVDYSISLFSSTMRFQNCAKNTNQKKTSKHVFFRYTCRRWSSQIEIYVHMILIICTAVYMHCGWGIQVKVIFTVMKQLKQLQRRPRKKIGSDSRELGKIHHTCLAPPYTQISVTLSAGTSDTLILF